MPSRQSDTLRWYIAFLLACSTALNYLDRQTLSILITTIQRQIKFSDAEYSYITSVFLIGYTIMTAVSGRLLDSVGTRRGLLGSVSVWSVASILHSLCRTASQFSVCRFLLGVGESANFPAGVKAVAEWFPMRDRAFAVGIFNSGSALGAAVGAPVVSFTAIAFGWRWAFVITGALGVIWVFFFQRAYHLPSLPLSGEAAEDADTTAGLSERRVSLFAILRLRSAWGCFAARIFIDPVTYFLVFWVPKYLQQERGFTLADIGKYLWIPYLALAAGTILGGLFPQRLVIRGWTVNRARKAVMLGSSLVIFACSFLVVETPSRVIVLLALAVFMFAHGAWGNITIPAEVFPKRLVGTVAGIGGMLGGVAGIAGQLSIGRLIQTSSFTPVFIVAGSLYLIAFLAVHTLVKNLGVTLHV